MDLATAKARLAQFQEFVAGYMVAEEDFGIIPGTVKPTLFKPGADKLCEIYGLSDEYEIIPEYSREDWTMLPPLFDYTIRCTLRSKRTGGLVATGMGSCNSYEGKYRWRDLKRTCPECGQPTIIKGREEYGGGYICWKKEGKSNGCGQKYATDDERITGQTVGRVENDDISTLKNTILKMAKKRAKIDATLSATRSSGIFTQDLEDIGVPEGSHAAHAPSRAATPLPAEPTPESPVIHVITTEQRKELFKVAAEAGWQKPDLAAFLKAKFGVRSTDEILATDYKKILTEIREFLTKPQESGKREKKVGGKTPPASSTNQAPVTGEKKAAAGLPTISDANKGLIWQIAKLKGWSKGTGTPDDPLHVFLARKPFEVDSVAKIREKDFQDIMNALAKGPEAFGLNPVA
jgi:hypothetical protein